MATYIFLIGTDALQQDTNTFTIQYQPTLDSAVRTLMVGRFDISCHEGYMVRRVYVGILVQPTHELSTRIDLHCKYVITTHVDAAGVYCHLVCVCDPPPQKAF